MPIYEYACTDCGHELETLQKMGAAPLQTCPQCGKDSLHKHLSAVAGIQVKSAAKSSAAEAFPSCGTGACPCACPE
ncbi:MAG: zinc ribbon domain-containing protein [Gammaproteobacteria bacterium]|nr:zinc ribbon domain-containing protein [Gammaproteobacteria bacterium]